MMPSVKYQVIRVGDFIEVWDDIDSGYAGCCGVVKKITRYEDGTWYDLLMDDGEPAMFQKRELNKLDDADIPIR